MSYDSKSFYGNTTTISVDFDYSYGNYTLPLKATSYDETSLMRDIINHSDNVDYLDILYTKSQEETKHIYKIRMYKVCEIEEPSKSANVADKYVEFNNPFIANAEMIISATYDKPTDDSKIYNMSVGSYLSGEELTLEHIHVIMRR